MEPINLATINLATIDLGSINLATIDLGGGSTSSWRRGPDYLATDYNADFRIQATS